MKTNPSHRNAPENLTTRGMGALGDAESSYVLLFLAVGFLPLLFGLFCLAFRFHDSHNHEIWDRWPGVGGLLEILPCRE